MRLALYEPDIAQNTATIIRLCACLGVGVDIIEPCGFFFTDKGFRRAGMDYLDMAEVVRHASWAAFRPAAGQTGRLVLLTTKAAEAYTGFAFRSDDALLLGRESAGVPEACTTPPMPGCASRCAPAPDRSMWRWPPPWYWGRR